MNGQELLADLLRSQLEQQPWYRKYANTVTAAVTALVGLLWTAVSAGVAVPPELIAGGLVLLQFAGVIGIKATRNGVTQRQIDELEGYVGRHRTARDA